MQYVVVLGKKTIDAPSMNTPVNTFGYSDQMFSV